MEPQSPDLTARITLLHHEVLAAWNRRDAAAFAALFADDASSVGFDGSEMHGRAEIATTLARIFADHQTAAYVARVRDVRPLATGVAVLSAVVGMVPPGQTDINPAVNAVQTLVAVEREGAWRIAVLHNTPAAYHGRPDAADALTAELREEFRAHGIAR